MPRLTCVIAASLATVGMAVASAGTADGALIERLETLAGPDVVMVAGDISPGDDMEFLSAVEGVESAVVLFRGPGGDPIAAMNIGTVIAEREYATAIVPDSRCASGCALAWLAGNTRFMAPDARLSLTVDDNPTEAAPSTAALGGLVRNYLRDIDLTALYPAIAFQAEAPAPETWMTRTAAADAGIKVEISAYEVETAEDSVPTEPAPAPEPETEREIGTAEPAPVAETADTEPSNPVTGPGEPIILALPSDMRWLVLESARDEASLTREGFNLPAEMDLIRVKTRNGMYASAIGPFPLSQVDQTRRELIRGGAIPRDSYISTGKGFVEQID